MAWSWSHTQEAYATAEKNVYSLTVDELITILAEWEASEDGDDESFDEEVYENEKGRLWSEYETLGGKDRLSDAVWIRASTQATCDNGGHNAWTCPYGCHTVSFS